MARVGGIVPVPPFARAASLALAASLLALAASLLVGCAPAEPASPVTGVVVAVDSAGLTDVRGFRLRTADGAVVDLTIAGPLENAAEFPVGHLAEHAATAAPVRVTFRRADGRLVATRIEDAD